MKTLICKALILATWHKGPVSCHPEIVHKGILAGSFHNKNLQIIGWSVSCDLGGPYRAGHGLWLCTKTANIEIRANHKGK